MCICSGLLSNIRIELFIERKKYSERKRDKFRSSLDSEKV